jgi:biotin synthase
MTYTSFIYVLALADILDLKRVPYDTLLRTIATARVVLPGTIIRLAAGRNTLSESEQVMCFMAGANAVFTGEQMLTTPCTYIFLHANI